MKTMRWLGVLLALSSLAAACGQIWSRSTALSLERDLATLLGTPGLSDSAPNCAVLGTTRTGFCVYEATEAELSSIIDQLALQPFTVEADGSGSSVGPASEVSAGCLAQPGFENPRRVVGFESARRAETIRLEEGVAFEYLLVFFEPVGGGICIQASYSYG
jgi:hypothetical protein